MSTYKSNLKFILTIMAVLLIAQTSMAVSPSPKLLDDIESGNTKVPFFLEYLDEMHEKGICSGEKLFNIKEIRAAKNGMLSPSAIGDFRILALLVDFSDHTATASATYFDSLIFDSVGNTIRDYYDEVSYGQLDIVTVNLPSSSGWNRAPQTYAYYVNGQNGTGSYPNNTQKLTEDLVDLVDSAVDFSLYDNDGNGTVDILLIIHSGTGAEAGTVGDPENHIWSHKWSISPRTKDGVTISDYTVQPEFWSAAGDMTIGVYAHELGHGFGLPDLYDTDYSSNGIGRWGLMAFGSWGGPGYDGSSPTHPSAWCKIQMGVVTATNVTSNITSQIIPNVENNQSIFRLWNAGGVSTEYFLIENRQKTGYDSYLPGSGLLIWHIDEAKSNNTEEWYTGQPGANHYLVALTQADGLYEMEQNIDMGDAADPFPGTGNKTSFGSATSPNSNAYDGSATFVNVSNITVSGDTVIADLIVGLSAGIDDGVTILPGQIVLKKNYPNPFNPSTTIRFTTTVGGEASLTVYNVLGGKIVTLLDQYISPGDKEILWDGKNSQGTDVSSGIYFYKLVFGNQSDSKKMVLVK